MKVSVIGATGYSGIELIRLLLNHPEVEIHSVISGSHESQMLAEIFPHLTCIFDKPLTALDIGRLADEVDLMFYATPSGVSKETMPQFMDRGVRCIDISGDFRLKNAEDYLKWYKKAPAEAKYLDQAVYGLSEIFPEEIKKAKYIANPGCYPTATLLGLIPAIKYNIVNPKGIVIDGKSGVSGAGRGASIGNLYSEVNENLKAYKLGSHQHIPEIEAALELATGCPMTVTFTTHLVPMTRGMMCTIYADLTKEINTKQVIEMYKEFYKDKAFVRVREEGIMPATKEVYGSNYCDIGLFADTRTGKLVIVSVIDNLVKGAAGQAVQNLNLMCGFEENAGLALSPLYP